MDRLKRIEFLFHQALELEDPGRFEFLKTECGNDEDLLKEVCALLESDSSAGRFMEEPVVAATHAPPPGSNALQVSEGTLLGRHRILVPIGIGGMGSVYRACDIQSEEIEAVKILAPELAVKRSSVRRFYREAKAVAGLKHPAIARILDFGEQAGVYYIAMEYVEGETLSARIKQGPLSIDQIANILLQVIDGLREAHSKGVVHRDLKPSNLMIQETGEIKILDFGLVKVQRDIGLHARGLVSAESLTLPGTVLGTARYMSPEQAMGKSIDQRSDIFSLGVIAYELLTGKPPFEGKTLGETLDSICHRAYQPIARFDFRASEKFETIVRKCLRKDPGKRYQSVDELGRELRKAFGLESPEYLVSSKRKQQLLVGAAALSVLLLVFVLLDYWFG